MGFFDRIKKAATTAAAPPPPPPPVYVQQPEPEPEHEHEQQLDIAGFDPSDEDAFYNAVLHMESEGQFGGTDESRAEICARFGIRDRSHWHTVKEGMYHLLAHRFGSYEEVSQREMNWRGGQMQRHMQQQVAKTAAGGGFAPVEGVTLDAWAAINAAIVGGGNHEDLIKGAGIPPERWQRVNAEWNARMARDTTFAIATVYGSAFQAASQGKFGAHAREATAARAQNRELGMPPPIPYEQYYEILLEQKYAAAQGKDPVQSLKACGLSIVDWTDLGAYMGYFFHRNAVREWAKYEQIHKTIEARLAAKYPGTDADISF